MVNAQKPLVTVVIATYNWSSVLHYAVQSVLRQTYDNWELWVVGDGCTDDTETVVLSFGDRRIHWHNLSENSGSQAIPNNKGIELAAGEYIAYLGHDDLWYPNHLETLVNALQEKNGDLGYTVTKLVQPLYRPRTTLCGLSATGKYEPVAIVPPSSVMHRRSLTAEIGNWRTYETSKVPIDLDLLLRAVAHDKRIIPVQELTVFKFPSSRRPNAYRDKKSDEQEAYTRRMLTDAEFRYHELMDVVTEEMHIAQAFTYKRHVEFDRNYVEKLNQARELRGLEPLSLIVEDTSFLHDRASLLAANRMDDICPLRDRQYLYTYSDLPENGLLLGANWYALERDEWGRAFRWVNTDAEILVTGTKKPKQTLVIRARPGPGSQWQPQTIYLLDGTDQIIGEGVISDETDIEFALPQTDSELAVYRLRSGASLQGERTDRILNFAVYGFWWKNSEEGTLMDENAWLRQRVAELETQFNALQSEAENEREWLLQLRVQAEEQAEALRRENDWLYTVKQQYEATIERLTAG